MPFSGSAVVPAVSVIVDPLGASSGTFGQATVKSPAPNKTAMQRKRRRRRDIMKTITILVPMKLQGQAGIDAANRGYAMAVLLVAMSIMAVMMTVVMPVWKQTAQREKEEELVFRGKQYVHAIGLFQRKFANAYPPNIDVLVEQRFLRKKFKDPITNDDFELIPAGQALPGSHAAGRGDRPRRWRQRTARAGPRAGRPRPAGARQRPDRGRRPSARPDGSARRRASAA